LSRSPARPTVLLFDIDGTLMTQKGVSRKAAQDAFGAVHGRADALDGVHFAGRTDPLIFGDGLRRLGLEVTASSLDAVFAAYLDILPGRMRTDPHVALLPGVRELLARVRDIPGFAVGLGTGNIEAGARVKLGHFDLWPAFDFGGFGSDAWDRSALIGVGAARGAARLGLPVSDCRVIILGDTPLDVVAAHANAAECLGVLTGGDTRETLGAARADVIFDDLTDPAALDWMLGA
jgi:phosphoglycolate phosphatase